ncbi:hypothetical protein [Roseateles saccharophilus]|uniref:hypothetical protein n=1 Tax=Roseateles saccharophilus TaxID=304 RepID=UPI00104A1EF7|nr:hypothetical protein [Roseateles saccharophilus]
MQPVAAPAAPLVDASHASGTVSVAGDTLDATGRRAGLSVELHAIQTDGSLGPIVGSASTGADGSFSIAMPAGSSTADGTWMLQVRAGGVTLRAYLYPGTVRVDASSEAWVREVVAAAGRVLTFPGTPLTTVAQISGAFGLYADATGDQHAALSPSTAAAQLVQALADDHALAYVLNTLRVSNSLPSAGTGDIGAFYALSKTYAAFFVKDKAQQLQVSLADQFGVAMGADGAWQYTATIASQTNGKWTPLTGAGGSRRQSASRDYQSLPTTTSQDALVSGVVGEFPASSYPVQPGARQLDGRRIDATKLNFTGGTDIQPLAFSVNEQVGGVETVSIAAGTFRAVRVVTDTQIVVPKSATAVTTELVHTTVWLAPGVGILKETDQYFLDGVENTSSATTLELSGAYANGGVWPAQLAIGVDRLDRLTQTHFCPPVVLPALHRMVTVESGPTSQGSPTLALALWNIDTGLQVASQRVFAGFSTFCPIATGDLSSLLVPEAIQPNNLPYSDPTTAAAAAAQSDVIHQVSGADLSDIASYTLPAVPDATQPAKFRSAQLTALYAAADGSGQFMASFNQSLTLGVMPHYVQALGPGLAGPAANIGDQNDLLIGVDWSNGRAFSWQNATPQLLQAWTFAPGTGIDSVSTRTIRTGTSVPQLWYASTNLLHLNDGSTIRISDGGDGPKLPYASKDCGYGYGMLVCLDATADQLVKLDPDTLAVRSTVDLGSYLRSLSATPPDFRAPSDPNARGIQFLDDSTYSIRGYVVHVGRWR